MCRSSDWSPVAVCPTSLPAILKPVFSQMFPQMNVFLLMPLTLPCAHVRPGERRPQTEAGLSSHDVCLAFLTQFTAREAQQVRGGPPAAMGPGAQPLRVSPTGPFLPYRLQGAQRSCLASPLWSVGLHPCGAWDFNRDFTQSLRESGARGGLSCWNPVSRCTCQPGPRLFPVPRVRVEAQAFCGEWSFM